MKKTCLFSFFVLLCSASFGAPLITSPVCNEPFKTSFYIASDIYAASNDIYNLFTLGLRYGIPGGNDIGLKVFKSGVMGDVKLRLLTSPPFYISIDIGAGYAAVSWNSTLSLFMDMELDPSFSIYLAARWLYPANNVLDTSDIDMSGVMFSPRLGLEFFRKSNFSIIIEGGVIKSWSSVTLGFNAAALIGYKL